MTEIGPAKTYSCNISIESTIVVDIAVVQDDANIVRRLAIAQMSSLAITRAQIRAGITVVRCTGGNVGAGGAASLFSLHQWESVDDGDSTSLTDDGSA